MNFKIYIDNEDYSEYTTIPFSTQNALDESLDMGHIVLKYTDKDTHFRPFQNVVIKIEDDNGNTKEYSLFVSSDQMAEVIGIKKYNHEIMLIEQSKWLERFTGIVKVNTNPITKDYISAQKPVEIYLSAEASIGNVYNSTATSEILPEPYKTDYKTPYIKSSLNIISWNGLKASLGTSDDYVFQKAEIYYNKELLYIMTGVDETKTISTTNKGQYDVVYRAKASKLGVTVYANYKLTFGAVNNVTIDDWSISDVVKRLLGTFETEHTNVSPRFKLNDEQYEEYSHIKAPEMALRGTLWECLSTIGGVIHAIPRLKDGIIYFDKLGKAEYSDIDLSNYCSNTSKFDIEQFASGIDSTVGNIVNTDDESIGTISAPYFGGLKTVRAETGTVQLTTDNVLIESRDAIERVVSLSCGYLSDGRYVGDITPYVFEKVEYDGLSSYDGEFPNSKAYAIKYVSGQKNITQLGFKVENAVHESFSRPAIINIIADKLGVKASTLKDENIINLQFELKYIPVISARVKQHKQNIDDLQFKSELDFNQSENKINAFAYGENMKGTIARLGNPEISKTYILKNLNEIPNVGDLFNDDYYISIVKTEFYKEFIRCEIALSKDFNRLSEYVGIDSQKRFFEISEKQAYDRYVNIEDYCIIGNPTEETPRNSMIRTYEATGVDKFVSWLNGETVEQVDTVFAKGKSSIEGTLTEVALPVNTFSAGNSLVFTYHYDDNYSAGNKRITDDVATSVQTQYQVRYTDNFGRIDTITMKLGKGKSENVDGYSSAIVAGNRLPEKGDNISIDPYFITPSVNGIRLYKDSAENIYFSYQMNFVTNKKGLIIGSAFAKKSAFISGKKISPYYYIVDHKIGKFDRFIDVSKATKVLQPPYASKNDDGTITFGGFNSPGSGKAWVICEEDGEIMLAQNMTIKNLTHIDSLTISFTHNIPKS